MDDEFKTLQEFSDHFNLEIKVSSSDGSPELYMVSHEALGDVKDLTLYKTQLDGVDHYYCLAEVSDNTSVDDEEAILEMIRDWTGAKEAVLLHKELDPDVPNEGEFVAEVKHPQLN